MNTFVETDHPRNRDAGAPSAGQFVVKARSEPTLTLPAPARDGSGVDPFADDPDVGAADLLDALHAAGTAEMDRHGLAGWTLAYDATRTRTLGVTDHASRVIRLSAANMVATTGRERRDTLMHEIAHAVCDPQDGHGPRWRAMAVTLGARPAASTHLGPDHGAQVRAVSGTCPLGHVVGRSRMPSLADQKQLCCSHADHEGQGRADRLLQWKRNALDPQIAAAAARYPAPKVERTVEKGDRAVIHLPGHDLHGATGIVTQVARTRCVVRLDGTRRTVRAPFSAVKPG